MTKMNIVKDIQHQARNLEHRLMNCDAEEVKAAMEEYEQLVDWFYRENENLMAPQQYEAAKKDLEYFILLVELAVAYYEINICEEGN